MTYPLRAVYLLAGVLLLGGLTTVMLAVLEPYLSLTSIGVIVLTAVLFPIGVVVAIKAWERPALLLVGAVAGIAVPWHTGSEGQEGIGVTLPDLVSVILVSLVAVRTLVAGDEGRLRSWVILPLAGIVLAGSVATLAAHDQLASFEGMIRYAQIFAVIPAATYLALRSRKDLKLFLVTVVALGLFEGIIGVYQFFTETGASYGESNTRIVGTFGA